MKTQPRFSRLIFLLFFIALGLTSFGHVGKPVENQIKFSPLRILNYAAPGLELSYELGHKKLSTQISVAYLIDLVHYIQVREKLNGVRFNLEEKYFIRTALNEEFKFYISTEVGYNMLNFVAYERFLNRDTNKDYWARWDKKSTSVIVNGKIGGQAYAGNFVIDLSVGVGVAFKHVLEYNKPKDEEMLDGILNGILEVGGRHTFFNVPFSIKMGYRF